MYKNIKKINIIIEQSDKVDGADDRNATLSFLIHEIHRSHAVVDFGDSVSAAGIEQDALAYRRLPSIDMRHNSDISDFFNAIARCHRVLLPCLHVNHSPTTRSLTARFLCDLKRCGIYTILGVRAQIIASIGYIAGCIDRRG